MSKNDEAVVLIHGLWMQAWTWYAFRRYFMAKGMRVYRFAYPTSGQDFDKSSRNLAAFVNSRPEQTIHLVGHSMGGLLAAKTEPNIRKNGKMVMLASPINGSDVAQKMGQNRLLKRLLNHAHRPLTQGLEKPTQRATMMVMGDRSWGLGRVIHRFDGPSDGTVSVASTQADWLTEHHVVRCNHMGILTNKQALKLTWAFLQKDLIDE